MWGASPFSTTQRFTMDKETRPLPTDSANDKFRASYWKLLDELGATGPHYAIEKVEGWKRRINALEQELDKVKQEWVGFTGKADYAAAQRSLKAAYNKVKGGQTVPERFGLDTSFLRGVGRCWDTQVHAKDQVKLLDLVQQKIDKQRKQVSRYYYEHLDEVIRCCENEGLNETDSRERVERAHYSMVDDFDLLTSVEFFDKYFGEFNNIALLPKEPTVISLEEALTFVRTITPKRLYLDLRDCGEQLGKVSRYQYNKWEDKVTALALYSEQQAEAKKVEESKLKVEIIGLAVDRALRGPESRPNSGLEEGTLAMLLYDPEVSPYLSTLEFPINDKTPLIEVLGYYQHNANLVPS